MVSRHRYAIGACALAAMAGLALAAASAGASFSGANGSLAWEFEEYDRGGVEDHHIQVARPGGRVTARISRCSDREADGPIGACAHNPSFSPSGRRIAFDRGRRLALTAPDGSGLVTLPKLTGSDSDPAFSPDATKHLVDAPGKRALRGAVLASQRMRAPRSG